MLSNLYIENVAVIEKSNIDFTLGFNVLTGETGAGKSIIIDSINFVLGNRTSKSIIRTGAPSAFVSATFHDVSNFVVKKAKLLGYTIEDGCLILQRELTNDGKNSCHINSRPASLTALKEIGAYLICIHGQNESFELISPSLHLHYIDAFSNVKGLLKDYRVTYRELKEVEEELNANDIDENKRLQEIDLLSYQIEEIEKANIEVGEQDSLSKEKTLLNNSEKIVKALTKIQSIVDGSYESEGVLQRVDDASSEMISLSKIYPDISDLSDRLSNSYYELQDISSEVSNKLSDIGLDPNRLEEIEERLDIIYKLSKKYGPTEEDILNFLEDSKKRLKELNEYSYNKEKLRDRYNELLKIATEKATEISNIRKTESSRFTELVEKEMAFLEMPNVKLVVRQDKTELTSSGFDEIEFLFSVNPGEPPKPVSKIASGGELSRMMLAIKTVLAKNEFIDTLIFDEIDTGISGSAAERVGQKLQQISSDKQVMCVTHQSQIAALADNHLLISKEVIDDRTYTSVTSLDYDGKVKELARIIDGVEVTNTAIEHAKQLLKAKG